jgi:uncharacterized protein YpmS
MRKTIIVMFLVLSLAAIAFRLGSTSTTENTGTSIPVSTEESLKFEENVKATADSVAATGQFDLEVTESQLTSYVYYQTLDHPEIGISDPQIYLRDGKIQMYGKYTGSIVPVNIEMVITPLVADGKIKLQLDSVKLGPASAPDVLVEQLQKIITDQIEPSLNDNLTNGLYIESLSIADGKLTLHGKKS